MKRHPRRMKPHSATRAAPHYPAPPSRVSGADIVFLARDPWDGVRKRSHHIVSAIARGRRIFYVEPPLTERSGCVDLDITCRGDGLFIVTPHLPPHTNATNQTGALRFVINQIVERFRLQETILWHDSGATLDFTRHLHPIVRVFDYQRQRILTTREESDRSEADLLAAADVIFTSTQSVYETVRRLRPGSVFLFPDCPSLDAIVPVTQRPAGPLVIGTIVAPDFSLDLRLLEDIIAAAPKSWEFEILGPAQSVTGVQGARYATPSHPAEIAATISRWSAALFPLLTQRSRAQFPIAKIGEILHLKVPIVATPTTDIVGPLGRRGIIQLAQTRDEFLAALPFAIAQSEDPRWVAACARYLHEATWEKTARAMLEAIAQVAEPFAIAPAMDSSQSVGVAS
jgi:hypothetical protein